MKTTLKARRILLDEEAATHLEDMITAVVESGGHVSRSPSKAVSWIISDFATRYFPKDKERLRVALFNRKACLLAALKELKSGSDEEIERLQSTLRGLKRKQRTASKGRANADEKKDSLLSDAP